MASKNPNRLSLLSAYNLNISSTVAIELSTLKICESQICIMHLHTNNELKHAVNLQYGAVVIKVVEFLSNDLKIYHSEI